MTNTHLLFNPEDDMPTNNSRRPLPLPTQRQLQPGLHPRRVRHTTRPTYTSSASEQLRHIAKSVSGVT